ncbi:MAG: hypothetical protein Q8861_15605 [Bacteroidota bacterium]|nr:hypothetical protein [Bacteroidota bacterium]
MKYLTTLCFLLIMQTGFAGPPFNTDDPEPVKYRHWEYYVASINLFQSGFASGTLPHIEVNYGIIPNGQLHVLLPLNYNIQKGNALQYGYENSEIGFKYRIFYNSQSTFQIGTFPIFEIPTINNQNFGNNKMQIYLPVWIQKSWGKLTTYGGGGYWINPGNNNKNWIFTGWEMQYDFSERITIGGELYFKTSDTNDGKPFLGINLGGMINCSKTFHVIYSMGHSITNDNTFMSYLGLLWTI